MEQVDISAWPRERLGKGASGRLRREGFVPAVLYGPGVEKNLNLKLKATEVEKALHEHSSGNMLVRLNIEGNEKNENRTVLLKHIERHPVRDTLLHIDLVNVLMDRTVSAEVPLHILGKAVGVVHGGILQQELRSIKVECLPDSLPERIDVDVTDLDIGHSIHVKDLGLPEGVKAKEDGEHTVVLIAAPTVAAEAAPAEEAEAEPAESPKGEQAGEGVE